MLMEALHRLVKAVVDQWVTVIGLSVVCIPFALFQMIVSFQEHLRKKRDMLREESQKNRPGAE